MLVAGLALVLCVGLLLCIPITLKFRIQPEQMRHPTYTWVWLFGLVRIDKLDSRNKKLKSPKQKRGKKSHSKSSAVAFRLIRQKAFRRRIVKFLSQLINSVKRNNIRLQMTIGLDNPADTGLLWAIIGPISGWMSTIEDTNMVIVPDFSDDVFEIDGRGSLSFIPLRMIILAAALVLSPVVWTSVVRARSANS